MFVENQWIKIKAPATVANMVCGFDILGFAVNNPYDEMEMRWMTRTNNEPSIVIINIDDYQLPTDPEKNVAGAALLALLEEYEEKADAPKIKFEVKINKLIKPGSGVGSSAASSAGAVVGANYLLGTILIL